MKLIRNVRFRLEVSFGGSMGFVNRECARGARSINKKRNVEFEALGFFWGVN
jgi:hypothetical protein